MRIRDPIHGTLDVSDQEKAVIDTPFFQRLRCVRQLGFGELAFPGATHTRHAHSLGAMHVSSRLFDAVTEDSTLSLDDKRRFRAAVRAAVLCHDLGHLPFSHASESIAPEREKLGLPDWLDGDRPGQATHEDYTARLLLDSDLTSVLRERYAQWELSPEHLASLVVGRQAPGPRGFVAGGLDWWPLLRSLVSGELDADRMDYLLRDSFFTGVNYGRYDFEWLVSNVRAAEREGTAQLALSKAAAFAFEDFLLSRYHMFVSVYLHHTSVSFDHMLQRFYEEAPGEFELPHTPSAFLGCDDVALLAALRKSSNRWAERIVARRGFKLVAQFTERDEGYDARALTGAFEAAGVEHFELQSRAVLSRYQEGGQAPLLYVIDPQTGRLTDIARYTPLFQRYAGALSLSRVYVQPEHLELARPIVARLLGAGPRSSEGSRP